MVAGLTHRPATVSFPAARHFPKTVSENLRLSMPFVANRKIADLEGMNGWHWIMTPKDLQGGAGGPSVRVRGPRRSPPAVLKQGWMPLRNDWTTGRPADRVGAGCRVHPRSGI